MPAIYFLVTFTLPQELRELAFQHQHVIYSAMINVPGKRWQPSRTRTNSCRVHQEAVAVLHMPPHVVWNTIRTSILRYPVAVSIVNDVSGERSKAIISLTVQRWLSHSGARFSTRLVKLD
ncbi:MAG: hypothetical protein P8144_14750 [Gammaproteobacteria bacterium]